MVLQPEPSVVSEPVTSLAQDVAPREPEFRLDGLTREWVAITGTRQATIPATICRPWASV